MAKPFKTSILNLFGLARTANTGHSQDTVSLNHYGIRISQRRFKGLAMFLLRPFR